MAAYNKFLSWVEYMNEGANVGSDVFMIALTNTLPVNTNTVLTDITQISYTNLSSRTLTTASSSHTAGVFKLDFNDLTLTASGGSVATFRYVVVYNDTVAADPLVAWFDYGSPGVTLADTETLLITFDSAGFYTVT